ncbi:TPA: DUF551 domain-containing protein [Escherichia coli]|uniref:DUF551 domain-containing protein n=1 Tax=Escherichia coli TaxID=562 RepID=UPI0015EB07B7|nr:DUF551 domain-containing protein [Escherichia coli]EJV8882869.1 DUF551 domain-containing protein [Escherichia coli]MCV5585148.1 DUF551 domain-containing protein [Escherichia coli]MDY5573543.1 DUF551 domain-containing protein [Escherichia coli]QMM78363.1 DUF551 domain-containing protein [Escherichia coli]QMM82592.1 DUF551 domain-containing protein [Escherichia coli]
MAELTKEWLQNTITSIESSLDEIPFGLDEDQSNMLTAFKIALASLAAVSDERAVYEFFMEKHFGESVDRRRAKNGDSEYMAWGMALGWIILCRAAMLQSQDSGIKDGWISCSERMPDSKTAVLVAREFDRKGDWRMKWATYIPGHPDANDGWIIPGASWKPSHWMPLPEPPQEVNQ